MGHKNKSGTGRRRLLSKLAKQSQIAIETRNEVFGHELSELAYLIRCAAPRARHVAYVGVKFPLVHSLIWRAAVCPETGVRLVGVIDL